MTSTVTEVTRQVILANSDAVQFYLSLIVVGLLVILIIFKEMVRIVGNASLKARLPAFDVAIISLLFSFGVIALRQLIDFLPAL